MSVRQLPMVSICMPTYNGARYLHEAMDSAISQNYPNLEIVVSDDNSHDDTVQIIESFKAKTKIPIIIHQHQPQGIGANWNHCVKKANGDYIKFLFQDDVLYPDCILKMMTMMLSNPKIGLVYSKRDFLYENSTEKIEEFISYYGNLHTRWESVQVTQGILSGRTYLGDAQFLSSPKNKIGEPTNVLLRKACFDKIGYFSTTLKQVLDSEYWYRVMKYFDIGFVDDTLVAFRLHDQQASNINKQMDLPDQTILHKSYYDHLFWQLHPKNQIKLLKLFHPIVRNLVRFKQKIRTSKI